MAAVLGSILNSPFESLTSGRREAKLSAHVVPWLLIDVAPRTDFHFEREHRPSTTSALRVPKIDCELVVLTFLLKVPFRHVLFPRAG